MAKLSSLVHSVPTLPGIDPAHPAYRLLLACLNGPQRSELTLGLLHKFNSLFTGVMFLTEECLERQQAGEPLEERLHDVLAALRDAHSYIERVARLHRDDEQEEAGYHELDVVIAAQLDLARLLLPRGTLLTHTLAEERLTFYATERGFSEILLHLVGNCGESLPGRGGKVSIQSQARLPDQVSVEVIDSGPGFSELALERLFNATYTSKDESKHAGMGLLRCRELARTFGGDLTAGNHSQGGAVLTLILPRDNSSAPS